MIIGVRLAEFQAYGQGALKLIFVLIFLVLFASRQKRTYHKLRERRNRKIRRKLPDQAHPYFLYAKRTPSLNKKGFTARWQKIK
ncbi:hypothetical protein ED312_03745 [Sinomicrobium pectinilyticum]|uniref:Uncharacterized protein n=1 Tax=Sinomicrobium pectinilyticum TaxID=1084421 RepID=A0A3N0EWL2_SINP1|nr:hypothetical protein ED312_03745 [Sinomicrobium pectinilyticum]